MFVVFSCLLYFMTEKEGPPILETDSHAWTPEFHWCICVRDLQKKDNDMTLSFDSCIS